MKKYPGQILASILLGTSILLGLSFWLNVRFGFNMFDAIQNGLANIEDDKVKDGRVTLNDIKFKL